MRTNRSDLGSLARLRREIAEVDRSIVVLLSARLEAAQRALRVRVPRTGEVTDAAQERRILERSRRWARELDVPEKLVELLFRGLLAAGKQRFRSSVRTAPSRAAPGLPVRSEVARGALLDRPRPQLVPVPTAR